MKTLHLGDIRIDRIVELEGPGYDPEFFFPDATLEAFEDEADWLAPWFWKRSTGQYIRSIQSFVVRTSHHTIFVDACVGNDKERPSTPAWHHRQSPWLDRLKGLGISPESVDYVLCTHLHADHVGWNTRLLDGRWVPTFPSARYIIHQAEFEHWEAEGDGMTGPGSADGCFEDSVLPVVSANQALLVGDDFSIDDRFRLLATPGHSPGHVCLSVDADGGRAILSGDVVHHPIQIAYPEWNSRFCMDPERARETRRSFVDRYADTDTMILAAHFATPTVGRIVSAGPRCRFRI